MSQVNNNIVTATLGKSMSAMTRSIYQYDYGMILKIEGVTLPSNYEVHFANNGMSDSYTVIGDENGVAIPDILLQSDNNIIVWLFLHTGSDDGETVAKISIPVASRARMSNATPTPVQQDIISETIGLLNSASELAEQSATNAEQYASSAEQSAEDAETYADRAEQAANTAGYMFMHIDDNGHLIYEKTSNVSSDFDITRSTGHLILEAI